MYRPCLAIAVGICAVAGSMCGGSALAGSEIGIRPPYALEIGSGGKAERPWRVWVFGRNNELTCVDAFTALNNVAREDQNCETELEPSTPWVFSLRARFGQCPAVYKLIVFRVSHDIRKLNLRVDWPKHEGFKRMGIPARGLSKFRATRARMPDNSKFAIATIDARARLVSVEPVVVKGLGQK